MSGMGWPTGISGWTDLHSLTSLSVANGMRRGMRGRGAAAATGSETLGGGQIATEGDTLDFTADDLADGDAAAINWDNANTPGFADFAQGFLSPGMFGMGLPGGFHGHMMGGMFSGEPHERPESGGFGWHGHPGGFDFYRVTGAVKVNLDKTVRTEEKPVITATAIDPKTQEPWEAVQDTLIHFDKTGSQFEVFYVAMPNGAAMKPTALLIEPDRILIAADPWGIFEFPRPDKPIVSTGSANVQAAPASDSSAPKKSTQQ